MHRDVITTCAADGCGANSFGRLFCFECAYHLPLVLHKTLRFLFNHGKVRDGFYEALENARAQLRDARVLRR